jgi:predicted glycoside hydrolase/deacetylase ChbG (UPF0249 family)
MKHLIVNADDLGLDREVNRGILKAAQEGCVRSATALAGAPAFREGVAEAAALGGGRLRVGIHLNLTGVWDAPDRGAPPGFFRGRPGPLLAVCLARRMDRRFAEDCLRRQIESFLAAGAAPTHFDGHHHVHVFPGIREITVRLAVEYGIRRARLPVEPAFALHAFPGAWATRLWVGAMARRAARSFAAAGIASPHPFFGFGILGRPDTRSRLSRVLCRLPEGFTELMSHPGRGEESAQDPRNRTRALETEALCDPRFLESIEQKGIRLASYADL